MTPEAEDAVAEFAADCGPDIYKMPTACETYLHQYLDKFPVELELLVAGLRTGVPRHVLRHPGGIGYDDHLAQIGEKFAAAAHTDPEAAHWTVRAWAYAVGQPRGFTPAPAVTDPDAGKVYDSGPDTEAEAVASRAMTWIVTLGGFFGGVLGGLALPLVAIAMDVASDYHTKGAPTGSSAASKAVTVVAVLIAMVIVGFTSGLAAFAGWKMGKGDEQPWATFAVAFGTALLSNILIMFCLGVFFGAPLQFAAVFGAVFKSAVSGGRDG